MTRLVATRCAICGTNGKSRPLYPANFAFDSRIPATFSARRRPDGIRFQIVTCNACGLVRFNPTVEPEEMARLYAHGTFTYDRDVANLRHTYGRFLSELLTIGAGRESLLEIGCGSGFLLREALMRGFAEIHGVEPRGHVIELALADDPTVTIGVTAPRPASDTSAADPDRAAATPGSRPVRF